MDIERRRVLSERIEKATQVPMVVLAVAFLTVLLAPELVQLDEAGSNTVEGILWFIWALFAFELIARTALAPDRLHYLRTHFLDVLTVLVPVLRPLLILSLIAAGARFWAEARTAMRKQPLSFVTVSGVVAIAASSVGVYLFERRGEGPIQTIEDAIWWSFVTISTVGYGDMYPKSAGGRGIAVLLMLVGVTLFGLITARIAAVFVEDSAEHKREERTLDEVVTRLDRLERMLAAQVGAPEARLVSTPPMAVSNAEADTADALEPTPLAR